MKAQNQPPFDHRQPIVLAFDRDAAWEHRKPDVDLLFPPGEIGPDPRVGVDVALDFLDALFQMSPLHSYQAPSCRVSEGYLLRAHGLVDRMCPQLSTALLASPSTTVAPFIRENSEGFLAHVPGGILTPSGGPMVEYKEPIITAIEGEHGPEIAILGERSVVRETAEGPLLIQRFPETFVSVSPSIRNRDWQIADFTLGRADIYTG